MLTVWRGRYERLLEWIVVVLMVALAVEVIVGVAFRYSGHALAWYDEVASILLAWVTYYGAALAALKPAHMGVPELVRALPPGLRFRSRSLPKRWCWRSSPSSRGWATPCSRCSPPTQWRSG